MARARRRYHWVGSQVLHLHEVSELCGLSPARRGQDQRRARAGHRAGPVPRQPGRSEDRRHLSWHLRVTSGHTRTERQYPGYLDRRSLSGTQPHFPVRQRRRSAGLHRFGGLDGSQLEPARRGGLPDRAAPAEAAAHPRDSGNHHGG